MVPKIFQFLFVAIIVIAMTSCDESPTGNSDGFNGVTHTDETGELTGQTDFNDWNIVGILTPYAAYPNPFSNSVTIKYEIAKPAFVSIVVNDKPDNQIRTLTNRIMPAGIHAVNWDGKNESGSVVGNAVYRVYLSATYNDTTDESHGDVLKLSN